jgi:hypothetical protein
MEELSGESQRCRGLDLYKVFLITLVCYRTWLARAFYTIPTCKTPRSNVEHAKQKTTVMRQMSGPDVVSSIRRAKVTV